MCPTNIRIFIIDSNFYTRMRREKWPTILRFKLIYYTYIRFCRCENVGRYQLPTMAAYIPRNIFIFECRAVASDTAAGSVNPIFRNTVLLIIGYKSKRKNVTRYALQFTVLKVWECNFFLPRPPVSPSYMGIPITHVQGVHFLLLRDV